MASENTWRPVASVYKPLQAGSIDGTDDVPHDHAVVRALEAKYLPPKHITTEPNCTVFVGRLSANTDEETLVKTFSRYGHIMTCHLVRDIVTGFSRRYAFIEYENERMATRACHSANKQIIDEKEILVVMECERTLLGWIPRRLGGGFGGRKESGQLRFGGEDRPFKQPIHILKQDWRGSGDRGGTRDRGSRRYWDREDQRDRRRSSRFQRSRSKDD